MTQTDLENWQADADEYGWVMPSVVWWKRLPIIRHIRAAWVVNQVARHNASWLALGKIPTGYDRWVIFGIITGMERKQ